MDLIDRDALYVAFMDSGLDGVQLDNLMEINQIVSDAPSVDAISKQTVLDALERERERLIADKMYGAEHILVHHAIRVIEELL